MSVSTTAGYGLTRVREFLLNRRLAHVAQFLEVSESEVRAWYYRDYGPEAGWEANVELELYLLVRGTRPERVVETGVNRGRSTTTILRALAHNGSGTLTSIDLPTYDPAGRVNADGVRDPTHVAPGMTGCEIPDFLRSRWTLVLGDAREELPRVPAGYDFFFHDSEHSYAHQRFEYECAFRALAPGGVLASDDVNWTPAWNEMTGWIGRKRTLVWPPMSPQRAAVRLPKEPSRSPMAPPFPPPPKGPPKQNDPKKVATSAVR